MMDSGDGSKYFQLLRRDDYRRVFKAILESLPPVRISALSKTLGETEDFVKRRVTRLMRYGFGFGADYNQLKTGLATLVVHLDRHYIPDRETRVKGLPDKLKWVLRWQGNLVLPNPIGILIFYVPVGRDYSSDFHNILSKTYNVKNIYYTDVTIYGRPDLSLTDIGFDGKVKTKWSRVARVARELYQSGAGVSLIPKDKPVTMDLLDIIILAILQKNAFYSLKDIAGLLKVSVSKVHRHLAHHLIEPGVLTGCRLMASPRTGNSSKIMLYIHGRTEPEKIAVLTSVLKRVFEFRSALYNSRTGEYAVLLLIDADDAGVVAGALEQVRDLFGEYHISVVARESIKSYTIPFLAFHREEREWSLESMVIDIMRRKLNDIVS